MIAFSCVYALVTYASAVRTTAESPVSTIIVAPHDPFSPRQILPFSPVSELDAGTDLVIRGARGSSEPASLIVHAIRGTRGLTIEISDLTAPDGSLIPASAVDVRLVKCWFQAARGSIRRSSHRVLVPELLLKDDRLVMVDYSRQKNYLRVSRRGTEEYLDISADDGGELPRDIVFDDATRLQPFDLMAGENRQVWLSYEIPLGAPAGTYTGKVTVSANGRVLNTIPVSVTVLPFSLRNPVLEYALYYRGILTAQSHPAVGSELKKAEQYRRELADMIQHGIASPTIYQRYDDPLLSEALRIRNEYPFARDHLYTLGTTTANPTDHKSLSDLAARVRLWKSLALRYGFASLYIYGVDEAVGERLIAQLPSWGVVRREGAGVFVALYEGAVELAGDAIDVAVLSGYKPWEVAKWRQRGKRVLCYGNPQVGVEDPSLYRRNYGFMLWTGGYHGCMPYAYQHGFGNIWNDFDHPEFRDHVFAYPTTNGLVGTVQWEGFRSAVDDIRYLSTLLALDGVDEKEVKKGIDSMLGDKNASPHLIRAWIIEKILGRMRDGRPADS